jgi:hypothetical protein
MIYLGKQHISDSTGFDILLVTLVNLLRFCRIKKSRHKVSILRQRL